MAKDAFWFRHDSNARSDPKMIKLLRLGGQSAIGSFWCTVEVLRESDGYEIGREDLEEIGFQMRFPDGVIDHMLDCGLLKTTTSGSIYSDSLLRRMSALDELREKRSEAGRKGAKVKWQSYGKAIANASQSHDTTIAEDGNCIASDGDQSRSDQSKKEKKKPRARAEYTDEFEQVWNTYPKHRRGDKRKAFSEFKRTKQTAELICERIKNHEQFNPNWINGYIKEFHRWLAGDLWQTEFSPSDVGRNDTRRMMQVQYDD